MSPHVRMFFQGGTKNGKEESSKEKSGKKEGNEEESYKEKGKKESQEEKVGLRIVQKQIESRR